MDKPKKHATDNDAAVGDKAKRPKHFHAGPNPVGAAEEEEKQSAVQSEPNAASPISRLDADTLGVVFGFLWLDELHPALCVSRSWSAAVCRMPCLRLDVSCTSQTLVAVSSSRLARHVVEFHTKLTSNELFFLALSMPQLNRLVCEIMWAPGPVTKMILPPMLETLELDLDALDAAEFNRALVAVGQLAALKDLTLTLSEWLPEMNFAPLSKCASLEVLTMNAPPEEDWSTQPTDAHIDQLRALTHLLCVGIPQLTGSSLAKLLRSPHSLQWTEMYGVANIDSASAAALRNLPALFKLHTWLCRDVSVLPVMTQLQWLIVEIKKAPWAVTGDAVVEALSSCRQLTALGLVAPVTSKHLARRTTASV